MSSYKQSSLNSALTLERLSDAVAKWPTIVCEVFCVVAVAAKKKSASSSTMNSSVKISGDSKKRDNKSAELAT